MLWGAGGKLPVSEAPPVLLWIFVDYSTVTDLARLRGLSTSQPLLTAI